MKFFVSKQNKSQLASLTLWRRSTQWCWTAIKYPFYEHFLKYGPFYFPSRSRCKHFQKQLKAIGKMWEARKAFIYICNFSKNPHYQSVVVGSINPLWHYKICLVLYWRQLSRIFKNAIEQNHLLEFLEFYASEEKRKQNLFEKECGALFFLDGNSAECRPFDFPAWNCFSPFVKRDWLRHT